MPSMLPTPPPIAFNLQQQQPQQQHQNRFERLIEIYENERLWIGRGFSQAGLLPTDRVGPYSTRDGSSSYKTLEEAMDSLLMRRQWGNEGGGNDNASGEVQRRRLRGRGWSFHQIDDGNSPVFRNDENASVNSNNVDTDDQASIVAKNDDADTRGGGGGGVGCNIEMEATIQATTKDDEHDDYHGFTIYISTTNERGLKTNVDDDSHPTDEHGWQYYPDFSPRSLSTPCPNSKRGMLDFVRRRKLSRMAVFRPDHFLPKEVYAKCDFCDSDVVDMLSSAMLDALALAALFAHGSKDTISDAQALELKCKLIDALSIGNNCGYDKSQDEGEEEHTDDYDPWNDINKVKDRLCTFAETCVGKRHGLLAHILHPDNTDVHQNIATSLPAMQSVMSRYLCKSERQSLARLLIKDIDRHSYTMHCPTVNCAQHSIDAVGGVTSSNDAVNLCKFRLVTCSNERCDETFSFLHQIQHEDVDCQYKIIPCPNGCGMNVCRKDVPIHIHDACNLRPAKCPLSDFGCNGIVQAQDVARHLNDTADRHFVLLAHRMLEYQTVMKDMSYHIRLLEENNARLERELRAAVAVNAQCKHDVETVSNDMKKITKRLGALEGTCRAEFKKVEHDRRSHRK